MAESITSAVNQKLHFARLMLKEAERIGSAEGSGKRSASQSKALYTANTEACLFHLAGAYRRFLQEIAQGNQLAFEPVSSASLLCEAMEKQGVANAGIAMLFEMEQNSWLSDCLNMAEQLTNGVIPAAVKSTSDPLSLTNIEQKHDAEAVSLTLCKSWLVNMKELIDHIREQMVEC